MSPSNLQEVLAWATVTIVIVGMIVIKPGQVERLPGQPFVNEERVADHGTGPPGTGKAESSPLGRVVRGVDIRPKNSSPRAVVFELEEELGVAAGIRVSVEEKDFLEGTVKGRKHLQPAAIQAARRMAAADLVGINALDLAAGQDRLSLGAHIALAAEVPNLDRQTTAEVAQGLDGYIEAGKTAGAAGAQDHAAALVGPLGVRRNGPQEPLRLRRHLGRVGAERVTAQVILASVTAADLGLLSVSDRAAIMKRTGKELLAGRRSPLSILDSAFHEGPQVNAR
jgi:hypothetical protein